METYYHRCNESLTLNNPPAETRSGIFLDRDGTLIKEKHYLKNINDIEFFPEVTSSLKQLASNGFSLYLYTNQAGIAHGLFNEETLGEIHQHLLGELEKNGVQLQGVLYCPHHPHAENLDYRADCFGRKPNPGLLYQAALIDKIDLGHSYVIGDKLIDVLAGKKAGTKTVLVLTGYGEQEALKITPETLPDYIAPTLSQAVTWIISKL